MLVPYFVFTSRTLQNSHVEALCLWKDLCPWKNPKREKVLGKKKKKKKQAQRRMKANHSVEKRKFFCESD